MIDSRKWRMAAFFFFLLALVGVCFFCSQAEARMCMGVKILTQEEQAALQEYVYQDLSDILLYNGEKAAVDLSSSTVYISQKIPEGTRPDALLGNLQVASHNLQLSFAPDTAFEDLAAAAAEGHVFQLNAASRSGKYMQYDLVFTTLPVLRLEGVVIGKNEKGKDICQGEMCLWNPDDPETGRYSVNTSDAVWHVRGGWSASLRKTPFKMDLKKKSGANQNLSLLGLGADDDWILNPMNADDTKVKEKLFSTLWNQRAEQVDWNEPMSVGEYVEVIIDRSYWGLFQLQRRVDDKFLELQPEDILLKSGADLSAATAEGAYEIISSNLTAEETYGLVEDFFYGRDGDLLDMDNFLDVNLFLECASAMDNIQKNIFYLLRNTSDGYRMSLIPWDTDMSWGVVWDGGFFYDFEQSKELTALRKEYAWMQEYHPDLDRQMAARWLQLREALLTMDNMLSILEQELAILDASGALERDREQWDLYYQGADSVENLKRILEERLSWLDDRYSEKAAGSQALANG